MTVQQWQVLLHVVSAGELQQGLQQPQWRAQHSQQQQQAPLGVRLSLQTLRQVQDLTKKAQQLQIGMSWTLEARDRGLGTGEVEGPSGRR